MSFGHEVRKRRRALGLTLDQIAERSGLTPNYIGTVENDRRDPSLSTVLSLARALEVSAGELLGGPTELSPGAFEASALFDRLTPEQQRPLLEFLQALAHTRR